jgi:NADH-quinone oxidoreductase subunit C
MASTITPDFITQKLQEKFGDDIQLVELPYGFPTYTVAKKAVYDVVAFLKNDPALSFQFLTTMCGLHYPNTNKDFGLMLQLHNLPENVQVRIKCFTDEVNPS